MIYGDEKIRTMARSILPATNRKSARQTATSIKRKNRRITRQALHDWKSYIDPYEYEGHVYDYGDDAAVNDGWEAASIKAAMWERRRHDKLSHFIHWAISYTSSVTDPEDRYNMMKRCLPDGLVGRHALSHLQFQEEFAFDPTWSWHNARSRAVVDPVTYDVVYELVTMRLGDLNRAIAEYNAQLSAKESHKRVDTCGGMHDDGFFDRARCVYLAEHDIVQNLVG